MQPYPSYSKTLLPARSRSWSPNYLDHKILHVHHGTYLLSDKQGDEVGQFDRGRLIELLKMSTEAGQNKEMATEVKIAVGAMEFANKVARDVMTRIDVSD
ncbi:unnamed protein product [Cylicostephanus goldi]|uniref:Uncharacterized protein n=1 Tax=Cylicostephanus goldi TaxID=71465 RepID=A0A3P7NHG2_CYLGO|nr:unnamed protein product [Cylicostephanus goldi]